MRHIIIPQADKSVASLIHDAPFFLSAYLLGCTFLHYPPPLSAHFQLLNKWVTNHGSRISQVSVSSESSASCICRLYILGVNSLKGVCIRQHLWYSIFTWNSPMYSSLRLKNKKLSGRRKEKLEKRKIENMTGSFIPNWRKGIEKGERGGRSKANSKC